MSFNRAKTKIMFHTKAGRFSHTPRFNSMLIVEQNKVLGYMLDKNLNNLDQVSKIKNKLKKIMKMIFMRNANFMPKWRKLYIMNTYMLPHFMYGSASFKLSNKNIEDLKQK